MVPSHDIPIKDKIFLVVAIRTTCQHLNTRNVEYVNVDTVH